MLDIIKNKLLYLFIFSIFILSIQETIAREPYLKNQNDDILCNSNKFILENNYPKKIDIVTSKPNLWYKNAAQVIKYKRKNKYAKIDDRFKKYFKSKIDVTFQNNLTCRFNGLVRLHGGRYDHFDNENFFSLRLKINNGHILNNNIFTFYIPPARGGNEEIFISHLFKELGILSPDTNYVKLNINGFGAKKYIFQERHSIPFLIKNKLIPSAIVSSNRKYNFEKLQTKKFFIARIDGGSKNFNYKKTYGIDHPKRNNIFFNSLSKLNFILHDSYIKSNFEDEHYYIDFSNENIKELVDIKKIGIFDSILLAVGGSSGLEADDRRFYYDPIYEKLVPIYYDGMPRILNDYDLMINSKNNSYVNLLNFNYLKEGAENSIQLLKKINLLKLQKKLKKNGFEISEDKLASVIERITNNLLLLKKFNSENTLSLSQPLTQDYPPKFTKPIKIIYSNDKLLDFESCDLLKKNCEKINFNKKEIKELLNSQTIDRDGLNYLFFGSRFFDAKFKVKMPILAKLKKIELNNFNIFHDIEDQHILIDKKNKKIKIKKINKNQNIIFKGQIDNWTFFVKGENQEKNNENALFGSCITFIDSILINLNFDIQNSSCLDSIKFLRSNGSIDKIMISNATGDGLAADFSEIKINTILIKNSNDDCINFKDGIYQIDYISLENCKDRGLSAGLGSNVKVNNFYSENTTVAVYAKDSSTVSIDNALINNTGHCLVGYRVLDVYNGGNFFINKKKLNCSKNKFYISGNSEWINQ
jgi:hypothetical protein